MFKFLSNQITSGFFKQLAKCEFATTQHEQGVSVLVTDYDSALWACFYGDIEDNDAINLQTNINGTLVEYRSFVSKQEILTFIDSCETPMIVRIDIKNCPYVSYICDFDDIAKIGKSLIPNVIEVAKKRDSQKNALYKWETIYLHNREKAIGPRAMKLMAEHICSEEGLDILIFNNAIKKKNIVGCCYELGENVFIPSQTVVIVGDSRDSTLIHELAHAVCIKNYGPYTGESHGPIFVRTYLDMLMKYLPIIGAEALVNNPRAMYENAEKTLKIANDVDLYTARQNFKALIGL